MVREDFCGVCAVVPLALAGAGALGYTVSGKEYRQRRRWTLILGSIGVIISILIWWKFKSCSQCRAT